MCAEGSYHGCSSRPISVGVVRRFVTGMGPLGPSVDCRCRVLAGSRIGIHGH